MRRTRHNPTYHRFAEIIGIGSVKLHRCRECGEQQIHICHARSLCAERRTPSSKFVCGRASSHDGVHATFDKSGKVVAWRDGGTAVTVRVA